MYVRKAKGGWRVEIARKGVRVSATFPHKATAVAWGATEEAAILAGKSGKFPARTVAEAFDRYEREVSKDKRGKREEGLRFAAILRDFPELGSKVLAEVKTPDLVAWRDARLKVVSKGTVQRDINLLRNVWTVARNEWHWCGESPWTALRMPGDNPARTQRVRWQEIRRIVRWLGYRTGQRPATKYQDSRAEALTLLSRRMDVMTLARISGHRDLRTLMESYYRESAGQIASRL
jgi:hypothetical protein